MSAIHLFVTLVHRADGIAPETRPCADLKKLVGGRLQIAAEARPSLPLRRPEAAEVVFRGMLPGAEVR